MEKSLILTHQFKEQQSILKAVWTACFSQCDWLCQNLNCWLNSTVQCIVCISKVSRHRSELGCVMEMLYLFQSCLFFHSTIMLIHELWNYSMKHDWYSLEDPECSAEGTTTPYECEMSTPLRLCAEPESQSHMHIITFLMKTLNDDCFLFVLFFRYWISSVIWDRNCDRKLLMRQSNNK